MTTLKRYKRDSILKCHRRGSAWSRSRLARAFQRCWCCCCGMTGPLHAEGIPTHARSQESQRSSRTCGLCDTASHFADWSEAERLDSPTKRVLVVPKPRRSWWLPSGPARLFLDPHGAQARRHLDRRRGAPDTRGQRRQRAGSRVEQGSSVHEKPELGDGAQA